MSGLAFSVAPVTPYSATLSTVGNAKKYEPDIGNVDFSAEFTKNVVLNETRVILQLAGDMTMTVQLTLKITHYQLRQTSRA